MRRFYKLKTIRAVFGASALAAVFLAAPFALAVENPELIVLCGAAFRDPMEDIIVEYRKISGRKIYATYGPVPSLMAQASFSGRGDVIAAPDDMFRRAVEKGLVKDGGSSELAFVVPCIAVAKGNPKKIAGLSDLALTGLKIAVGNPETTRIGEIALDVFNGIADEKTKREILANISVYADDAGKLAAYLLLGRADAVVSFHYVARLHPDDIDLVELDCVPPPRPESFRAAELIYSRGGSRAGDFIKFLGSSTAKDIIRRHHYFATAEEASQWSPPAVQKDGANIRSGPE
jgi:molybdate transport system substrate-binding protein